MVTTAELDVATVDTAVTNGGALPVSAASSESDTAVVAVVPTVAVDPDPECTSVALPVVRVCDRASAGSSACMSLSIGIAGHSLAFTTARATRTYKC